MGFFDSIARFYQEGGWAMHFILIILAASIAIWVERVYALYVKYNINAQSFWDMLVEKVKAGAYKEAYDLCEENNQAVLPRVLQAGVSKAGRGEREIQDAIDEANLEVMPLLEKRTPYLGILANVATLTGLLGTIFGLIQAFAVVAAAPPDQKQTMLAGSISIAMNTTAFGLLTAIPTMIVHGLLQGRTGKIVSEVDNYSVKLLNILSGASK